MREGVALAGAGAVLVAITVAGVLHVRALNAPQPEPLAATSVPIAPVPTEAIAAPAPPPPRDLPTAAPTVDPVALRSAWSSVKVVMYTTTWCPQCKRAKAWMRDNQVAYVEHDVEASASAMSECKKLNPRCSIPTIDIEGQTLIGFGAESLRAAMDRAASIHTQ